MGKSWIQESFDTVRTRYLNYWSLVEGLQREIQERFPTILPPTIDVSDTSFTMKFKNVNRVVIILGTLREQTWTSYKIAPMACMQESAEGRLEGVISETLFQHLRRMVEEPASRLTRRFLELPFYEKLRVVANVGVLKDGDLNMKDEELFLTLFKRVKEDGSVRKLWAEVESRHRDCEYECPFGEDE